MSKFRIIQTQPMSYTLEREVFDGETSNWSYITSNNCLVELKAHLKFLVKNPDGKVIVTKESK